MPFRLGPIPTARADTRANIGTTLIFYMYCHKCLFLVDINLDTNLIRFFRLQFPTGRASGLDEAIELALSEDRVTNSSVTTLQHVITAVSTYRALQKEICNAKDVVKHVIYSLIDMNPIVK